MSETVAAERRGNKRGKSLTEIAYSELRRRIITGEMPPGLEVSEMELADGMAMSKTPVREALGRLGIEGFVEAFPRRGYRVTPVTVKDLNNLFAVRAMLEGTAGALAAQNMSEADFARLAEFANARYVVGESMSVESFIKANEEFHAMIAKGSGNPRLYALLMSHLEECARFFHMGARVRDVNPETNADHNRIVEALRKRDPEAARTAMVEHNENTRRGLLLALVTDGGGHLTF